MPDHGTFTKGDRTRVAQSPAEAVDFRYRGYVEVAAGDDGDLLRGAELDKALEDAGLPKTGSADEKRARLAQQT